jgi:hypothetical protein
LTYTNALGDSLFHIKKLFARRAAADGVTFSALRSTGMIAFIAMLVLYRHFVGA